MGLNALGEWRIGEYGSLLRLEGAPHRGVIREEGLLFSEDSNHFASVWVHLQFDADTSVLDLVDHRHFICVVEVLQPSRYYIKEFALLLVEAVSALIRVRYF